MRNWLEAILENQGAGYYLVLGICLISLCALLAATSLMRLRLAANRRRLDANHNSLIKFSSAVMNSGSLIVITDSSGAVDFVNARFCSMTGFEQEEVLGDSLSVIVAPGDPDKVPAPDLSSCLQPSWEGELLWRRKTGDSFWTTATISAVFDDQQIPCSFVISAVDITDLKIASQRMEQLALFDSLTGLANRRLFLDRLEQTLHNARRRDTDTALLFLDLDRFKRINDTLGHDAGDLLLLTVADRLKSCVRSQDTVARLGGDEFTVLLNDIGDPQSVRPIAQSILDYLKRPITLGKQEIIISTSIGITFGPTDSDDPETLMRNADLALYRAKERGRDRYAFFTEELNEKAAHLLRLEQELRHALRYEEFALVFQPQIDLATNETVAVEALIRWMHPERGTVSPDDFIPVAEETGLIVPIGAWVLRTACMQMKLFHQLSKRHLRVAVNLSARQFRDPALESVISSALTASGLAPRYLEIEVTESMLMDDMKAVSAQLSRIKSTGVTVTIDDFGTGYSSLRYLKRLPVDILKVDREFVRDIPDDLNDMEVTAAIIALAHKLGLKVIAEGVESTDQKDFLAINRCDFAQGYLFSEPLSFEDLYRRASQDLPPAIVRLNPTARLN